MCRIWPFINILIILFRVILANSIWRTNSSYNLGTAITAIAIVVAFVVFIADKRELRFSLSYEKRKIALYLAGISIVLSFLGELDGIFLGYPFVFQIASAIAMVAAIAIYLNIILRPIKNLNKKQISILKEILGGVLSNSHVDKVQTIGGCIEIFDSLLQLSLENKDVQNIFRGDFASDIFQKYFSESYYVFEQTVNFYIKHKKERKYNIDHIKVFLKRLMMKSLENNESFLNIFIEQKVYPDALFCLDEIMVIEKDKSLLETLFGDYRLNGLSHVGQLNYISILERYFKLVREKNNHVSLENGYQKNYELNDQLIHIFFEQIVGFFESTFDQIQLGKLFDKVGSFSWDYAWGVKTEDKSENIRKYTGAFLYDLLYNLISKYKIENEDIFRLKMHKLHDDFVEVQQDQSESNVAYKSFTEKLKGKIIGDGEDGDMPNYMGYFPAMIKVYFYIYGFSAFSEKQIEPQSKNLHVPIFAKLAEGFPKLYQGFKQEFYDAPSLPDEKKELLEKQGQEILDQFINENMVYNFDENSLSYYYSGKVHSSKILLDSVKKDQLIKPVLL